LLNEKPEQFDPRVFLPPIMDAVMYGNPYGGYSGGYKHCATGMRHI